LQHDYAGRPFKVTVEPDSRRETRERTEE